MKRFNSAIINIFITLFILAAFSNSALAEVAVGDKSPNFKVTDIMGKQHQLSDFTGRTVVLEWTNADCPFVRKHYDTKNMQNLQRRYTNQGVVWLTVNSSAVGKQGHLTKEQALAKVEKELAFPTAYIIDEAGELGKSFGAKTTPHMFVINGEGTVVYAGAIDNNSSSQASSVEGAENYVANALDSIMAKKPIEVASTQAYGCSVKYSG